MNYQFKTIAVGGTFDHLHLGHQRLLLAASQAGQQVFCGLTTRQMTKGKILAPTIQSFDRREKFLIQFLKWHKANKRVKIFPLLDPFGPTVKTTKIEAVVATKETGRQVDKINQIRLEKKLAPLAKVLVKLVPAEDKGKLSSTRIRLGEINREGQVFNQIFARVKKDFILPQAQRKHFKKPLGQLLKASSNNLSWLGLIAKKEITKKPTPIVVTVGDIVTRAFLQTETPFSLAVIDHRSRRLPLYSGFHQRLFSSFPSVSQTENKPGTLSFKMIQKIKNLLPEIVLQPKTYVLEIKGEEDLTVLPIVLLAPLESLVFYGQPDQGIVKVRVTEKIKEKAYKLLQKFTSL